MEIDLTGLITAEDKLQAARDAQVARLSAQCQARIYAGFDSDALGSTHHYPAKETDQANLSSSVLASLLPGLSNDWTTPFWCADESGAWAMRVHTAAQIQQVGRDAKVVVLALMAQNDQLAAQARQSDNPEEITWPT